MSAFSIRTGSIDDLDVLVRHRQMMWKEIYPHKVREVDRSEEKTRVWISLKLKEGLMLPFIAEDSKGVPVGSGCLLVREDQSRPFSDKINEVYLLSMFTRKESRGKGIGTGIVEHAIQWSRENGYDRITLHSSRSGRSMYSRFGFTQTNEMKLLL